MAIGFGIIGCGMISRFHEKAIADARGAKFIGCYDQFAPAAERFADESGCQRYASLDEMLADPKIQAVSICTPSGAHFDPAVAAARAGRHVIIEKPLEITLKKCDQIIRECKKNRVKLAACFQSRFHESAQDIKNAIDKGRFGKLTMGDAYVKWFRTQEYYDSGAWRGTWDLDGGGALMNQAIHSVDLLTWFMGPVVEVSARAATLAHKRIEVEDTVVATLRFKNGALGVIEASTAVYPGYLKKIEIHGSKGTAVLEEEDLKVWDFAKSTLRDRAIKKRMAKSHSTGGGASDPTAIGHHGHALQFQDFVQAINRNRRPAVDGVEARRSVEIIVAIYKAAETGGTVKLPLKTDPRFSKRKKR